MAHVWLARQADTIQPVKRDVYIVLQRALLRRASARTLIDVSHRDGLNTQQRPRIRIPPCRRRNMRGQTRIFRFHVKTADLKAC